MPWPFHGCVSAGRVCIRMLAESSCSLGREQHPAEGVAGQGNRRHPLKKLPDLNSAVAECGWGMQ